MRDNFEDIRRVSPLIADTLLAQQLQLTYLHKRLNVLDAANASPPYPAPEGATYTATPPTPPDHTLRYFYAAAGVLICLGCGIIYALRHGVGY